MRKLLVHSDNTSFSREEIFPVSEQYRFDLDFDKDVDVYIDGILRDGALGSKIMLSDIVFIKVALSANYLEYLGIRLAYHIRLTKSIGEKSKIPIVLIAEESVQFLGITCVEPSILFTSGVYVRSESIEEYHKIMKWFADGLIKPMDDFDGFIEKIRVEPPSNYHSHHSIANEWSLFRYHSMFVKEPLDPRYERLGEKIKQLDYLKTLHFKFMEARAMRQGFNHKNVNQPYTPIIKQVEGRRIGIIDDDTSKGWNEMYDYLLGKSGAIAVPFLDFHRYESRAQLLGRVRAWIDGHVLSNDPIDVYILDLRLHDDDFTEVEFGKLSGIEVLKYLGNINPGIKVVVSTASNKVWNFQRCLGLGVSHFTVKESPETFSSREETKATLRHFSDQLAKATVRSFLAGLYREIELIKRRHLFKKEVGEVEQEFSRMVFGEKGFLDKIFGLLLLDSRNDSFGTENDSIGIENDSVLNQCLLLAFHVLENYCDLPMVGSFGANRHKKISSGFVWLKSKDRKDIFYSDEQGMLSLFDLIYGKYENSDEDSTDTPIDFSLNPKLTYSFTRGLKREATFLVKLISVLHFREEIERGEIRKIMRLRYYRSNVAAHFTGEIKGDYKKISSEDIRYFINLFQRLFISKTL